MQGSSWFRQSLITHGLRAFGIGLAVVSCAACGAMALNDAFRPGATSPLHRSKSAMHDRSWMSASAKNQDLLYVADYDVGGLVVYAYQPPRIKYVGFVAASQPRGECVDKTQNVFVVEGSYSIFEYRHGGTKPVAILSDPVANPLSCSVDPSSGNLAVVGASLRHSNQLVIFRPGHTKPTVYSDPNFGVMVSCSYDDSGNLFIDGNVVSGALLFSELPKGGKEFRSIALDQTFQGPQGGGVQWSGSNVAVGDYVAHVIYQFDVSGSGGTEVGRTPLNGSGVVTQFFIENAHVVVPSIFQDYAGFVKIYGYPHGGSPSKTLRSFSYPDGVVVSLAKH